MGEKPDYLENYDGHEDISFICVQFQFDRDDRFKFADIKERLLDGKSEVSIYSDDNDKSYINLNFYCDDLSNKWGELQRMLFPENDFGAWCKNSTIITCPNNGDWYDYLLLWSFNEVEELDEL